MARSASFWDQIDLPPRTFDFNFVGPFSVPCTLCGESAEHGFRLTPHDPVRAELKDVKICPVCVLTLHHDTLRSVDLDYDAKLAVKEWEQGIEPRNVAAYEQRIRLVERELNAAFDRRDRLKPKGKAWLRRNAEVNQLDAEKWELVYALADMTLPEAIAGELITMCEESDTEWHELPSTPDRPLPEDQVPAVVVSFLERAWNRLDRAEKIVEQLHVSKHDTFAAERLCSNLEYATTYTHAEWVYDPESEAEMLEEMAALDALESEGDSAGG